MQSVLDQRGDLGGLPDDLGKLFGPPYKTDKARIHSNSCQVTLVWSDPPGEGLQNDLDLLVVAGNRERHGNAPDGSKDFDRKNNVEQETMIIWPPEIGRLRRCPRHCRDTAELRAGGERELGWANGRFRHGRDRPGHPCLSRPSAVKTWMLGTRPGMTS
ncbi:hypothetical protein [Bradyrhizobium sp.]|uniref:hypothetical protein n=1 Tax=Bradyrhizobium sp. TaxID=376 RepID=UPI002E01FFE1|nr:hypothetical protein [Bradyrhizobium sp.]